jgi:phosphatidylserine/phosphatidylglycerophosphate/cardiolipin synthase-like enzyme
MILFWTLCTSEEVYEQLVVQVQEPLLIHGSRTLTQLIFHLEGRDKIPQLLKLARQARADIMLQAS